MQTAAATGGSRVGPLQTAPGAAHTCTPKAHPRRLAKGCTCGWPVPRCFSEAHPLGHWLLTYRLARCDWGSRVSRLPPAAREAGKSGSERLWLQSGGQGCPPCGGGQMLKQTTGFPCRGRTGRRRAKPRASLTLRVKSGAPYLGQVRASGGSAPGGSETATWSPADVRVQEQPRRVPESGRGSSACRGVRGAPRKASRALRDAPTCFAPSLPVTTVVQTSVYVHVMETWGPGPAEPNESGAE